MTETTNECRICGTQERNRIDMLEHIHQEHPIQERLVALFTEAQPEERSQG